MTNTNTGCIVTDNLNVIVAWKAGKNARNHRETLWSVNSELHSHHYKIGHRTKAGVCVVADLTLDDAPKSYNTEATLAHIQLAKQHADTVFHQLVSECSPLFREEVPF